MALAMASLSYSRSPLSNMCFLPRPTISPRVHQIERQFDTAALAVDFKLVVIALQQRLTDIKPVQVDGHAFIDHHGALGVDHHILPASSGTRMWGKVCPENWT